MEKKIYQIEVIELNGKKLNSPDIPDGLFSFDVFRSREDAEKWASIYAYGSGVTKYDIKEYDEDDIEDYRFVELPTPDDKIDECCPHCGCEVKLSYDFRPQRCPECGSWIAPCNLCNHDLCDCSKCPLLVEETRLAQADMDNGLVRVFNRESYGTSADYVLCPDCGRMLVNTGRENCPLCGEELQWADEDNQEVNPDNLEILGDNILKVKFTLPDEE